MPRTAAKSEIPKLRKAAKKLSSKKVWRITDFDELFKMADDKRKGRVGPLAYTKSFVSLSGSSKPCEIHHFERLKNLKAHPDRHLLRSVFEDLKNWAAHKPQHCQGYLVDSEGEPAELCYIAAQLDNVDRSELKKTMPVLVKIGLIERVVMNGQMGEQPTKQDAKKPKKESKKKKRKKAKKTNSGTHPPISGEEPPISGKRRRTFKKDKGKVPDPLQDQESQRATLGLTASGCQKKENGNDNGAKNPSQALKGTGDKPTTSPPAAAPPLPPEPHESDDGGRFSYSFLRPPDSALKKEPSRQGLAYGRRVYLALKLKWDTESTEAAREIGSFASKHDLVCLRCRGQPPEAIDTLLNRGLKEAQRIAGRKANRHPGKVWHTAMNKIINKYGNKVT